MKLYGDGIHDDTEAIQSLLDEKKRVVRLPLPDVCYMISKPLRIHSYQKLELDRFCHIKLMDNSNCMMLINADEENEWIEVTGGIWDLNNLGQMKNPFLFPHDDFPGYNGFSIYFKNVKNLRMSHMTMKDPITFAITLEYAEQFTVEDITFDFNHGNPWPVNMDGVHLNGGCKMGVIRNLKGTCYDDLVAINAPEGQKGDITDIQVDGLFAYDCHSAVRIHAGDEVVKNISISNVYGTYYQYCVGFSTPDDTRMYEGYFDNITIKNIYASKAVRHSIYQKDNTFVYPLIWVQETRTVKNLHISELYRDEENVAVPAIWVKPTAAVENMVVCNVVQKNYTGEKMPVIENGGRIDNLVVQNIRAYDDEVIKNDGEIKNLQEV